MEIEEGKISNGILFNRMIRNNKNFLCAFTGSTGSGKSWSGLRFCELWYKKKFNKEFPIKNVCFEVGEVMENLVHGDLKRGEILILEEAGTSMGSLDFQNKASKLFNYILQTFRSRNIGLVVNLPYLSMLNKQTRMLLHMKFQTVEIDKKEKKCWLKPFLLQVNQSTGKVYNHYPRAMIDDVSQPIELIGFSKPSEKLIKEYENKKADFVMALSKGVLDDMRVLKLKNKKPLTANQQMIVDCWKQGMTKQTEIAKKLGKSYAAINVSVGFIRRKGYFEEDIAPKPKEK